MSHELDGNRMFSVKLVPWHGLGVVLQEPPTSAEAIIAAGMAWQVEKRKLFWLPPKKDLLDVQMREVPGRVALVRDEDERILAVVSDDYEPLQNIDAFSFFDEIVKEGLATYETAGVLFEGRKVWIQARLKEGMVVGKGDELRNYLMLSMGHDGKTGVTIQPSSQRIVCNNTLQMSLAQGLTVTFAHRGDVVGRLRVERDQIMEVVAKFGVMKEQFEAMAGWTVTPDAVERYVEEVLDFPKKFTEQEKTGEASAGSLDESVPANPQGAAEDEADIPDTGERVDRAQENRKAAKARIMDLHETGLGADAGTRGSLWGAYNAVVEFVDYYAGARAKDRGNYLQFGDGAKLKVRALELANKITGADALRDDDVTV